MHLSTSRTSALNAIAEPGGSVPQKKYYHPGVGTDGSKLDRLIGGGTGKGLADNIKSGYKWLATKYRPGDRIFLFGFSRGAFTVRSLGGMISCCGLLDLSDERLEPNEIWARVEKAFECYKDPEHDKGKMRELPFFNASDAATAAGKTPIHFVGVWDTVGALGVPDDLALLNLIDDPREHEFHDTSLGPTVANARHAIAIDEMRASFAPTLWTNWDPAKTDVKQVWFPGVHGDVGGGYLQKGLSDAALLWMIEEAEAKGLELRAEVKKQIKPEPADFRHDSVTGIFAKLKTEPRCVPLLRNDPEVFHPFAFGRHDSPPLYEEVYWPTQAFEKEKSVSVSVYAREHWNQTGIFLKKGVRYLFEAEGEWLDSSIPCGPGGTNDGSFHFGELFQMVGSAVGEAENLWRGATGNAKADFWFTKRHEEWPWFALIGMVANGAGARRKQRPQENQYFLIGSKCEWEPDADGYLYCFANDAWHKYENNKGSVRLTVTQA